MLALALERKTGYTLAAGPTRAGESYEAHAVCDAAPGLERRYVQTLVGMRDGDVEVPIHRVFIKSPQLCAMMGVLPVTGVNLQEIQ